MEPVSRSNVIKEDGFIHQIKFDGIRGLVTIKDKRLSIQTKKGNICTSSYPELFSLSNQINAREAILDGEMVVFDKGKPSFSDCLKRNSTRNQMKIKKIAARYPVKYIIFDILILDGKDLRDSTLKGRQTILKSCFTNNSISALADNFPDGEELFVSMKKNNMEGIVSKRLNSLYTSGKNHIDWYKTKIKKKMLCVIIGARKKHGSLSSLLLGIYKDNNLINIGSTYSGLKENDLYLLKDYMDKMKINETTDTIYVNPNLTCWVKYTEWTMQNHLRHPVLLGFSDEQSNKAIGEEVIL